MKVTINGYEWKVKFYNNGEVADLENALGFCKSLDLEIYVRKDMHRDAVRTTIIHEVVHAYLWSHGFVKIDNDSQLLFSEEQVCDFVAMNFDSIQKIVRKIYLHYLDKYKV